jgi:two-component system sensor histidine kinase BaeS
MRADPDRFAQVIANLLENAIKFATSTIEVTATSDHGEALITVDDDGPGIDTADLPHVFERLYVVKRTPQRRETGSGLGLAISHELVAAMGGSIEAAANDHGGARMIVHLPS